MVYGGKQNGEIDLISRFLRTYWPSPGDKGLIRTNDAYRRRKIQLQDDGKCQGASTVTGFAKST